MTHPGPYEPPASMSDETRTAIQARLAAMSGLRSNVIHAIDHISFTGAGKGRTMWYVRQYVDVREELRGLAPELFGQLTTEMAGVAIAFQRDALLWMVHGIDVILVIGSSFGFCNAPPPLPVFAPTVSKLSKVSDTLLAKSKNPGFLITVASGLLVAYLVYKFGWNH